MQIATHFWNCYIVQQKISLRKCLISQNSPIIYLLDMIHNFERNIAYYALRLCTFNYTVDTEFIKRKLLKCGI